MESSALDKIAARSHDEARAVLTLRASVTTWMTVRWGRCIDRTNDSEEQTMTELFPLLIVLACPLGMVSMMALPALGRRFRRHSPSPDAGR